MDAAAGARALRAGPDYARREPERETLHRIVREHLRTFYAAVEHGFEGASLPDFVREDLEGYVRCGVLGRGFAHSQVPFRPVERKIRSIKALPQKVLEKVIQIGRPQDGCRAV